MPAKDRRVIKFDIPCGGGNSVAVYIGNPSDKSSNPLHFQSQFYADRGIAIPSDIMQNLHELYKMSKKHNVSFQELCINAFAAFEAAKNSSAMQNEIDERQKKAEQYMNNLEKSSTSQDTSSNKANNAKAKPTSAKKTATKAKQKAGNKGQKSTDKASKKSPSKQKAT